VVHVCSKNGMRFTHLQILQIFHRKVYPESTALARSLTKKSRKRGGTDDEPPASPKLRCRKEPRLPRFGCCANRSSSPDVDDDEQNCSKSGHWIRTDADCKCACTRLRFDISVHKYYSHTAYIVHLNQPLTIRTQKMQS
jgi:hypothetical protein